MSITIKPEQWPEDWTSTGACAYLRHKIGRCGVCESESLLINMDFDDRKISVSCSNGHQGNVLFAPTVTWLECRSVKP